MHFGDAFPSILIEGSGILMKIPKMSLLFMEGENHEKCAANNQRILLNASTTKKVIDQEIFR